MKRFLLWLGLMLFVLLTMIGFGVPILVRSQHARIEHELQDALHPACPTCTVRLEETGWSWFSGLGLYGVRFHSGSKGAQEVDAQVEAVVLWPVLSALWHREFRVASIRIERPEVTYTDGEKVAHPRARVSANDEAMITSFVVERVRLHNGAFTYVRDLKGTHAVFTMHKIDVIVDAFGNDGELRTEPTQAHASCQVGHSGHAEIDISAKLFAKPLSIDTELEVAGQRLEDLSVFFKPNAGVELKGELVKGHWTTHQRGPHLDVALTAAYKDFAIKLNPMYDRSDIVAFFTNLGAAIVLRSKDVHASTADQTQSVHVEREPGESLVSFTLRGVKEAAIDVARGKTKASE